MNKIEKKAVIEEIAGKLKETKFIYVTDASGLSVEEVNLFRRKCFESGVEYKVYKNTLIQKAVESIEEVPTDIKAVLKGFSGIIFSDESNNAPAKVIKALRKEGYEKPLLKAASIDGDLYVGDDTSSSSKRYLCITKWWTYSFGIIESISRKRRINIINYK